MLGMSKLLEIEENTCAADLSAELSRCLKKIVWWVFGISLFLMIFGLCPWFADFFNDARATFFQRIGSLIVVVFVFTEFRLYRHITRFDRLLATSDFLLVEGEKISPSEILKLIENFLKNTRKSRFFLISIGLVGTIIWGYGDLIYLYFSA